MERAPLPLNDQSGLESLNRGFFLFIIYYIFSPFLSPLQRDNTGLSYNYSCYEKDTGAKKIVI